MSFKRFVAESILSEKNNAGLHADLIFQKLLDVLDHAHLDLDDDRIEFHIGRVTKNSKIDLKCVIRNSHDEGVRLGRNREDGSFTIVVDTPDELPVRTEIDSFLAKDRSRAQAFKAAVTEYLGNHMDGLEPMTKTQYEDQAEANTSANFEERYQDVVKKLKERMEEYKGMVAELNAQGETEDMGKRETVKLAKRSLARDQFGDDEESFKKVARGLLSKDENGENTGFANNLSKENKERLDNRLGSFYDQHIKPLLK